ncbi:YicC/YloC family endoribonuclease [Paenibacillus crassostreae]|uniref:Stress-induced protein n=1 Tax=Paenibacillus crassostreae TaxID=1763538 RepID=A0A167C7S2_9BACL|nr:YicC/YloC family endoribonuclease [Paenibacillus crassostreae]AOZ91537.1 YicC family protein [Paenibacillus crassostreae]OAB72888.1 stress-induced protein [Paenibacillus crassostreae]
MSFSMTGYGQSSLQYAGYKVELEIKSVNHRYCEVVLRMPREWTCFEDVLRRTVQQYVKRGRVDIYINKEADLENVAYATLNHSAVKAYLHAADQLNVQYGLEGKLTVKDILALPDVLLSPDRVPIDNEEDMEKWGDVLQEGLRKALESLMTMRRKEGQHLMQDVEQRLERLQVLHDEMVTYAPHVVEEHRNKLRQRLTELQDNSFTLDDQKLGMEIAVYADRSNIDEELIRLQSHFKQCRELLLADEVIGRKLDFLIQEMNREVNTIGSKSNYLALVTRVVEMKAELEKIREQAANIE